MSEIPDGPRGFFGALPVSELKDFTSRLVTFIGLDADSTAEHLLGMLDVSTVLADGDPAQVVAVLVAIAAHKNRLAVLDARMADGATAMAAVIARNIGGG